MTDFSLVVADVTDRINAAPVDQWLKDEAYKDLDRLIEAFHASHFKLSEETTEVPIGEAVPTEAPSRDYLRSESLHLAVTANLVYDRNGIKSASALIDSAKLVEAYLRGE